jgi:hypothetical protein
MNLHRKDKVQYVAITHDVAFKSNLDLLLRGTNGAINKLADAIGGGLQAVALALSTPHDNSAEVQKQIDQVQAKMKTATDQLQSAIDQSKGE